MTKYILHRLIQTIPVLIGISILAFMVVRLAPGDAASLLVDLSQLTPEQQQEVRRSLGLEQPLPVQYLAMMRELVTGDLTSFRTRQPTFEMVLEALPITLLLGMLALCLALVVGIVLGVLSALRPNGLVDNALTVGSLFGISVPQFWLGLMLIFIFSVNLGWLPVGGIRPVRSTEWNPREMLPHLVLPTLVLAGGTVATLTRFVRAGMLEVLSQDYVRTARAKGLRERTVIVTHALRNSLITVVTLVGVLIPLLLSGSVIVESVFAIPGMGRLAVGAANSRDYPVVMTVNLLAAVLIVGFNLLTDVAYTFVDPRIKVSG